MSISESYWAMVNNFRALYGTVLGLPQQPTVRQERPGAVPDRETRQYVPPAPRPSGPQYDGRQARSHCNKNTR